MSNPSQAILGAGTLLKRGDGATPEVFTPIAEVKDISGPHLTRDFEDVTHQSSPGGYTESLPKLKSGGELQFDLHFLPADPTQSATAGLIADYDTGAKRNFKLVYPFTPNVTASFAAYVQSFDPKAPVNAAITAAVTLKITGPVVWN
jgi:hypothetical protein